MNIEESIQQMGTLIEAWELDEAELNQTDINAMQVLLKEIQELKLELSGYRQAILEDKDMLGLKEENQELKKQLEEYKEQVHKGLYNVCLPYQTGYNKAIKDKEAQQKEFIKYLENEKDRLARVCSNTCEDKFDEADDILQKYKEIIGDNK